MGYKWQNICDFKIENCTKDVLTFRGVGLISLTTRCRLANYIDESTVPITHFMRVAPPR